MAKLPKAVGPYSILRRVGDYVFLSGQVGFDLETNTLVEGVEKQAEYALKNIRETLKSEGLDMDNVFKTTIFLADMKDFKKVNEVYASFFKEPYPARSCVAVKELPLGALVEIEVIAYVK